MSKSAEIYARSLYSLASEEGIAELILTQMEGVCNIFDKEPEFTHLMTAANLSVSERIDILDCCFRGRVAPYLLNFLKLLTEKGYFALYSKCCAAYRASYYADNGIVPVTVISAIPLKQSQKERLQAKLGEMTGKNVLLSCRVDSACIGGIRLDYDGKCIDGTIAARLQTLTKLLKQ